jgi:hypothetical protein
VDASAQRLRVRADARRHPRVGADARPHPHGRVGEGIRNLGGRGKVGGSARALCVGLRSDVS